MDKRLVYIVLGSLVILYLVGQKTHPEFLQSLQAKATAIWNGKSHASGSGDPANDQWEKHRQEVFAARLAESKRCAVAKYPALAVADSEMNIRFVYRYQWMVKENNPRLKAPNWPELLADDCAAASAAHAPANTSPGKHDKTAHGNTPMDSSVAAR